MFTAAKVMLFSYISKKLSYFITFAAAYRLYYLIVTVYKPLNLKLFI